MSRIRRGFSVALIVASTCAFAGTSASAAAKPVSAGRWAASVCPALVAWQGAVAARADSTGVINSPRLERLILGAYLKGLVKTTDRLVKRLDATSAPDVEHGTELAGALRDAFAGASRTFSAAQQDVATLDTSSDDAFTRGLTTLQQQVTAGFAAAQKDLTDAGTTFPSPSLDAAMAKTRACQRLAR